MFECRTAQFALATISTTFHDPRPHFSAFDVGCSNVLMFDVLAANLARATISTMPHQASGIRLQASGFRLGPGA